jgi:hypothetical protein
MSDENKITTSLPETGFKQLGPTIRKPSLTKSIFNPLLDIDWDKIKTKEEAFLIGYINGQNNSRGR